MTRPSGSPGEDDRTYFDFRWANIGGGVAGRDYSGGVLHGAIVDGTRDHTEAKLLRFVETEVAGRLAQSLHNRVYIELHKEEDPTQVVPPWAVDVKLGNAEAERCPEGTTITELFDRKEIGGKLLVLGAPGSGKTTMLLQLAAELVSRAIAKATEPVPVLLNLSAWKQEFKDIPSWMVADLKLKYGVRKDIAQKWIENGRILPLLDGLDELMSERQETCVRALNDFLPEWGGVPLVACSRLEEYQLYKENLGLNGAIVLQPLTDEQIEQFLQQAKCEWLWDAVRNDTDVMDVKNGWARSPLLLTILVLASDGLPAKLWLRKGSMVERRKTLFEAYIAERLKRPYMRRRNSPATRKGIKPYQDDEKAKALLGFFASWLTEEIQTELFIENLQPKFLKTLLQKSVYGMTYGLLVSLTFGLACGLVVSLLVGLFHGLFVGLVFGLFYGLFVGLSFGLIEVIVRDISNIKTVETIRISWQMPQKKLLKNLVVGLFEGLVYGLTAGMVIVTFAGLVAVVFTAVFAEAVAGLVDSPIGGLVYGGLYCPAYGLIYGPVCVLVESFKGSEIDTKNKDNQGIRKSILNSIILGLIFIPFGILVPTITHYFGAPFALNPILPIGACFGFFLGAINSGLSNALQHSALRITLWLFGYSPWNYSRFLRYCTERGFLQRVGGGYRFVHALLRDHFAEEYGNVNSQR